MNKFKKIKQSGFTLIELLIVICIIGILSTIVLSSLSNSRAKAYDAKVKMQLRGFRIAAESYYTSQISIATYGPATNSCLGIADTTLFNAKDPQKGSPAFYIDPAKLPSGTVVQCGSSDEPGSTYAVKATLYSNTNYWCVDSKGFAGEFSGVPASSVICQ